jgi:hypothetical protein
MTNFTTATEPVLWFLIQQISISVFHQIQIPSLSYSTKDIKEIETRVMRVIGEYDKISAAKVNIKID